MTTLAPHQSYQDLSRECEILREELAAQALEAEQLRSTEIPHLTAEYQMKIGSHELELFSRQCEVQRLRRTIDLIQFAMNRMEEVSLAKVERQIEVELAEWTQRMQEMAAALQQAELYQSLPRLSAQESLQLQTLFRQLAKRLHPDLNPEVSEQGRQLWLRVCEAYQSGDLNGLLAAELLVGDMPTEPLPSGLDELAVRRDGLKQRIILGLAQLDDLRQRFPLSLRAELADTAWIGKRQAELKSKIEPLAGQSRVLAELLSALTRNIQHGKSTVTH